MRSATFTLLLLVGQAAAQLPSTPTNTAMPSREQAAALFDKVVQEITRLDGDGLTIRHQRPEPWEATIARLRLAAIEATTPAALGQVFQRLRATYPNMHAGVSLATGFNEKWMPSGAALPVTIRAETLTPIADRPVMRVASVDARWAKAQPTDAVLPKVGDIVIAMNQRPMNDWLRENEIFCRYPLAGQCPVEFQRNLARGFLFWLPETPLTLTLRRDGKDLQAKVNVMPVAPPTPPTQPTSATPATPALPETKAKDPPPCDHARPRMPEGFVLTWTGTMVCVFTNPAQPDTQIWRIESFAADQSRVYDAKPGQYKSVKQETDTFFEEFWMANSPKVKHLIIDVAGNSGGEVVVRWLQLLAATPFQMPYGQVKKIREFNQPNVRKALFWGSSRSQVFIEALKRDGQFESTVEGGWLPRQQKFCFSDDDQTGDGSLTDECNAIQHAPRAHGFSGRVTLVLDQFCNSACVTFARTTKANLNARIVGLPDVADTSFSRLQLHFGFDASGQAVTGVEDASAVAKPVGRFTLAATRSTDDKGTITSAKPLMPDRLVPRGWQQNGDEWALEAIKAALK